MDFQSTKTMVYQSERGHVIRNGESDIIQLEFGNLFLRFDFNGFQSFKKSVDDINWKRSEVGNEKKPYFRKIFIALKPSGVTMAFNREEITELQQLLEGAMNTLSLKKLSEEAFRYSRN